MNTMSYIAALITVFGFRVLWWMIKSDMQDAAQRKQDYKP